ncbi:HK97 gp10 family phage protein [Actinoallomurus spadix]|uniref:HK97 gp10 family phage protein n=1 Tax=Actinoallomurus spadix TaxID=79912 RepID=A0ABN0WVS3_9ACTN|nr:HK97 gp10 family phage protein [Actinoallomurus spadix]MCO5986571.1 HK97 gp10 family phage protein [Actinoallomurus spadix]
MAVDRSQLQALIRDLGQVPPAIRKELRPVVKQAAQPTLARMKSNASWSTRIPGAITMRAANTTIGVRFRVNAGRAPHARPYENDGNQGTFRAPLWGDREHWYPHQARPFFYRAVEATADQVRDALGDAVMDIAARHGL